MNGFRALVASLCLFVAPWTATAESTAETDEAKFVRLTRHLEAHPLSDTDKSMRTWLIDWAAESEDITVMVCDILGTLSDKEAPHNGIYITQLVFGNAAYQIAHPDKRDDLVATQMAAARSALAAYRSVIAEDPGARIPKLDDLLAKDAEGTLDSHLGGVIAGKCSDGDGA